MVQAVGHRNAKEKSMVKNIRKSKPAPLPEPKGYVGPVHTMGKDTMLTLTRDVGWRRMKKEVKAALKKKTGEKADVKMVMKKK